MNIMGWNVENGEMLHEFFAVTLSGSVYRVCDTKDEAGTPIVEKIAVRGEIPTLPVGHRLHDGSLVVVTQLCILLVDGEVRGKELRVRGIGNNTSNIVGLFLTESEALSCLEQGNLKPWDERWIERAAGILKTIALGHPVFVLAHMERIVISQN